MFLSKENFSKLVSFAPLVAIDLCIMSSEGILLGKRKNAPAKDSYFVPGGRIRKNETLDSALNRIIKEETNISENLNFSNQNLLGVYEHFYEDNFWGNKKFNTHYIVFAYLLRLNEDLFNKDIIIDNQHSDTIWYQKGSNFKCEDIHPNTKVYLGHNLININ